MTAPEKRPWRMFLPPIAVLVLWGLWSAWWAVVYFGAQRIYARELPLAAERGIVFSCASQSWGGYPFRVETTCEQPILKVARGERNVFASTGRLAVVVQAYNPFHAIALIDGPTSIDGVAPRRIDAEHGRVVVSLRKAGGDTFIAGAEIPKLSVNGEFAAALVLVNGEGGPDRNASIAIRAEGASVPVPALGSFKIGDASAEAAIPRELIETPNAIAGGAEVSVKRLEIVKGSLAISASGSVGLDPLRRPKGKLATKISDIKLLFEDLRALVGLKEKDAQTAETMVKLLNAGKTTGISADFIAKDGALYWGPLKLTDLPPLPL
jgi:hypothetical protein